MTRQTYASIPHPAERTLDRATLVLGHRRLVYLVAWSHAACGLEIDDLVQEGMCGLLTAADRYDPARGVKFWTYARHWVREAIRRAVLEHSRLVHVPVYLVQMINQALARRSAALGRLPTTSELAKTLKIDPAVCERALRALDRPISFSTTGGGENASLNETIPDAGAEDPETLALDAAAREELRHLLIAIPARERMILRARFGLDGPACTFEELARMHAISSTRVRQLYRAALVRLRGIACLKRAESNSP